ncbi:MAG: replication protein [Cressdnaviricota sp.]|nr:MAG: replication protein [Cressdnaviricota sp.]
MVIIILVLAENDCCEASGANSLGKSMTARRENPGFYTKMPGNILWEGYDDQDTILIEDFGPYDVKMSSDLKIWCDRYAFRARILYGTLVIRPKKIIITSQYHPSEIWDDQKTVDAICDRFVMRKMEKLPNFDRTVAKPKKTLRRRKDLPLVNRPPLYRQNNGIIEPYINNQMVLDEMPLNQTRYITIPDSSDEDSDIIEDNSPHIKFEMCDFCEEDISKCNC